MQKKFTMALVLLVIAFGSFAVNEALSTSNQLQNTTNYTNITAKENNSSSNENLTYPNNEEKVRHVEEGGMRIYLVDNETN